MKENYEEIDPPSEESICHIKEEDQRLLMAFAKKGDLLSFKFLVMRLYPKNEFFKYKFDNYIYGANVHRKRETFPTELKTLYDKAVAANNERGWARHGYMESIEKWEKLFQDEGMKSLYKQAGN